MLYIVLTLNYIKKIYKYEVLPKFLLDEPTALFKYSYSQPN